MTTRRTAEASSEELGQRLLESVRQMKARNFARVTPVEVNEVVKARQSTGLSQPEFASALSNPKNGSWMRPSVPSPARPARREDNAGSCPLGGVTQLGAVGAAQSGA